MTTMTLEQRAIPLVKSSLAMKRRALEFGLQQYRRRLAEFEKKYNQTSQQFLAQYQAGKLGDDADWMEWEFVLDAADETSNQLNLLDTVQL